MNLFDLFSVEGNLCTGHNGDDDDQAASVAACKHDNNSTNQKHKILFSTLLTHVCVDGQLPNLAHDAYDVGKGFKPVCFACDHSLFADERQCRRRTRRERV